MWPEQNSKHRNPLLTSLFTIHLKYTAHYLNEYLLSKERMSDESTQQWNTRKITFLGQESEGNYDLNGSICLSLSNHDVPLVCASIMHIYVFVHFKYMCNLLFKPFSCFSCLYSLLWSAWQYTFIGVYTSSWELFLNHLSSYIVYFLNYTTH